MPGERVDVAGNRGNSSRSPSSGLPTWRSSLRTTLTSALIVVLDEGTSRAEGRPLAPVDAELLRVSCGVEGGAFALRLVGKDGGVKRSGSDVVSMDALYPQIDSMPMRQEEMRRR